MSEAADGNGPVEVEVNVNAPGEGEGGHDGEVADGEAVEPIAEAAVEIARIEANRDVAVAEIHADQEIAVMEAISENHESSELEQCRTRIAELEGQNTVLLTELELLRPAPSIPPQSTEPPPSPQPEPESVEEAGPKESQEAPEPEKPRRKPHRWI